MMGKVVKVSEVSNVPKAKRGLPRSHALATRTRSIREQVSAVWGFSLFEVVIVVGIFSMVALLTTRSTFLTLRGSRKSDAQIKVKENLEYGLSVFERQIRNADLITSVCDGSNLNRIDYKDSAGTSASFSCESIGPSNGYIASGSARLTSSEITVTSCSFVCSPQDGSVLPGITVNLTGSDLQGVGAESSQVSVSTQVFLRNY